MQTTKQRIKRKVKRKVLPEPYSS